MADIIRGVFPKAATTETTGDPYDFARANEYAPFREAAKRYQAETAWFRAKYGITSGATPADRIRQFFREYIAPRLGL
jgi:hypothetical protein